MIRRIAPSKEEVLARKKARLAAKIHEQQDADQKVDQANSENPYLESMANLFTKKRQQNSSKIIIKENEKRSVKGDENNIASEKIRSKYIEKSEKQESIDSYRSEKLDVKFNEFKKELLKNTFPKTLKIQKNIEFSKEFRYLNENKDVTTITQDIKLIGQIKREYETWRREIYPENRSVVL